MPLVKERGVGYGGQGGWVRGYGARGCAVYGCGVWVRCGCGVWVRCMGAVYGCGVWVRWRLRGAGLRGRESTEGSAATAATEVQGAANAELTHASGGWGAV